MPGFTVKESARQDLLGIGRYTANSWGRERRDRYLREIDSKFALLAENPGLGRRCDHIREGYRVYQVGRYLIFYLTRRDGVDIVRILHERMDAPGHLSDRD